MNKSKEKIEIIDTLLTNDDAFNVYIKDIEQDNEKTPINLEDNILRYIQTNTKENIKKKDNTSKKYKFVDILKIAACTILSVLLWQAMAIEPPNNLEHEIPKSGNIEQEDNLSTSIMDINDIYMKINNFMLNPINFERRDE